jgi:hypothetical protein
MCSAQNTDTVYITLCKNFWKTGEPMYGMGFSLLDYLPGVPVLDEILFVVDSNESCINHPIVSTDSFQTGYYKCFEAYKIDDYDNGVSILDIMALQKHILGLEPLASPYSLLAGDVNMSGGVNNFDATLMAQIILETNQTTNPPWRFFPETCVFSNPSNPFIGNCPCIAPNEVPAWDNDTLDFTGVKVGDVDGDANPNGSYAGPSTFDSIMLTLPITDLQPGEQKAVPLSFQGNYPLFGLQLELLVDTSKISLDSVSSAGFPITFYNNFNLPEGRLRMVLHNNGLLSPGTELITLHVTAKDAVALSDVIRVNHDSFPNAAATFDNYKALKVADIIMGVVLGAEDLPSSTIIVPASPNPYRDATYLTIDLEQNETVNLIVTDLAGRETYRLNTVLGAGDHRLEIPAKAALPGNMGFYRLQVGSRTVAGKIVRH